MRTSMMRPTWRQLVYGVGSYLGSYRMVGLVAPERVVPHRNVVLDVQDRNAPDVADSDGEDDAVVLNHGELGVSSAGKPYETYIAVTGAQQNELAEGQPHRVPIEALVDQCIPEVCAKYQRLDVECFQLVIQTANVRVKELVGEELW